MEKWLESIHSDGSIYFVSNPCPAMNETVTVRIRMYEHAPVRHVILKCLKNGAEFLTGMTKEKTVHGLVYYQGTIEMTEARIQYQFYLVCDNIIYFYNQKEITTYVPDLTYDFVLLAGYQSPSWVQESVFYQIFPDRFYNGDPANDVTTCEYEHQGHKTMKMSWTDEPLPYEKSFSLDFYGGDLQGVRDKIPYLKELGVTAVYLNPVFTAPSVHKYDCVDYFHVDPHFGGDDALEELSNALHENDMRLILDISINHTGAAHRWFNRDGLYFDKSIGAYNNPCARERKYYFFDDENNYKGWADFSELPTLNYTADELRQIIYRNPDSVIKKWLKPPYNIDGWRFDVADVMARNNEIQLAHEVWPQLRRSIKEVNPEAYILAEDWGDCAPYLQGYEWDSAMNYYGFGRIIRHFLGLPDLFLERHPLLKEVSYRMSAEDFKNRVVNHLSKLPFIIWQNQYNLFDSHDISRIHTYTQVDAGEYRGAVMLLFMFIGAPSIYYGDEAGIAGKAGTDQGCRYPMPWHRDFQETDNFRLYQTMARLKTSRLALKYGGMKFLYAAEGIIALTRFTIDEVICAVISVADQTITIRLPLGAVGAALPSATGVSVFDHFGERLNYKVMNADAVELTVEAHKSYLFDCVMI